MELVKVVIVSADGGVLRVLYMSRIGALELSLDYERRGVEVSLRVELL